MKSRARYVAVVAAICGLVLTTVIAVGIDTWRGQKSEHTSTLVTSLITIGSGLAGWLTRDNEREHEKEKPPPS